MRAEALSRKPSALTRNGDPATGEFGDAKLIRKFGDVRCEARLPIERMLEEETQHFPRRVRPSRVGVGAGGTAARPCVAGTMNVPVFGDHPPAPVGKDGASIGMAVGHSAAKHLRCRTRGFGGLLENPVAVVGVNRGVAIAMENDRRYGRASLPNC